MQFNAVGVLIAVAIIFALHDRCGVAVRGGAAGGGGEATGFPVARDPCDYAMSPDLGWLQEYIKVGFFTDFKYSAWRYYMLNETTYGFLWFNSIAFSNMDFVREACPEAARLALLLRAEERLPIREAEAALMEYFALAEVQSEKHPVPRSDAEDLADFHWPLREGEERLRRMIQQVATPEEYSVDVVMPYCHEPLDELLSRATGYDDEWLSVRVPLRHVRLLLYRLQVCAPAGTAALLQGEEALATLPVAAVEAARHFAAVEVVLVDARPQAWEAARYFLHLSSRYDRLADFTLFLHPDVFEHVNPRTLRNLLHSLRVGAFRQSGLGEAAGDDASWYEYLSLSHHYLTRPSRASRPSEECVAAELGFRDLHRFIFGDTEDGRAGDGLQLGDFGFYCCSQFVVHRSRVHRRARDWYRRIAEETPWEHCATSYMELLWHAVFNSGQLHEQKRQERSTLPFFLRVDNFIEATSDGLV